MAYKKIESYDEKVTEEIAGHVREILRLIGEDPEREGLLKTPERVAKAMQFMTQGYFQDGEEIVRSALFEEKYRQMVIVKDIELFSMCEHHMLPFFGKYYFAYIPKENGRILGISKVARVVGYCSARLQLQERLARDIVNMLMEALNGEVEGMAIVMKGTHLCKTMRGVRNNGQMSVAHLTGVFQSNGEARREFYKLIELQH